MAQITIYLSDELEAKARKAATARRESVSRWIAGQVARSLSDTWPKGVLDAAGALPEFPSLDEIRKALHYPSIDAMLVDEDKIFLDRGTKKPFDAKRRVHAQIKREAMARGLMVYAMGGTVDGGCGDHVLLAPPFIIDSGAIDTIVERLGDAIDAAIGA